MIGFDFKFVDQSHRVAKATDDAAFRNLGHAAATIRKDAVDSIVQADGPSAPGEAPHTHTQKVTKKGKVRKGNLQRAIAYDVTKEDAIIGPRFSVVGLAGRAHELGEEVHGEQFDERPYMWPATEQNLPRFAQDWAGSIGE